MADNSEKKMPCDPYDSATLIAELDRLFTSIYRHLDNLDTLIELEDEEDEAK